MIGKLQNFNSCKLVCIANLLTGMKYPKFSVLLACVFFIVNFYSCKKERSDEAVTPPPVKVNAPVLANANDSAILYTRDLYLWYKQLPQNFNQQSYSDPEKMMEAIRQYSQEPGFSAPVDHWSFAMKKDEWDGVSSGIGGDFGMGVSYQAEDNLRVTYIEKTSPAGRAGIRRGWRISKINGSANIAYTNREQVSNNVYSSTNTSFTFIKPDNTIVDVNLKASGYQENPIFLDSVYTLGSKKIGYLVFNSFMGDTTDVYQKFNSLFSRFASQNVSDLIVDLRYNGGGYVSVQEKLANYLVTQSATGGVMMKQMFNDKLSEYNETTNFKKMGSLNTSKIVFIVSNRTASASELLINNLKPYMDVTLVGPSNTHGKPVGFFPYPVLDWYIFPVSFRTVNKNGEGNYFNGINLDIKASDGIDKDWGDLDEASLAMAVRSIAGASFRSKAGEEFKEIPLINDANKTFDQHSFKGAIDTRRLK